MYSLCDLCIPCENSYRTEIKEYTRLHFVSDGQAEKAQLRILLVDDHTDTVITLGALLRNLGYEVACAETVKQALQLAKESKFDLLVSDIGLPDGSGHDLMRQIRSKQAIAGIALSGFGMEDDLEKSRAVGFTEHLIKPINVDRLQSTLREIAQKQASLV